MTIDTRLQISMREWAQDLGNRFADELANAMKTCINCQRFAEDREECTKFGGRPPARVIAFGCPGFEDKPPF